MNRWIMPGTKVHSAADLGACLRARRKKLGYTQEQIAEFEDCSPRFVGELERGDAATAIERVIRMANGLGLDIVVVERGQS